MKYLLRKIKLIIVLVLATLSICLLCSCIPSYEPQIFSVTYLTSEGGQILGVSNQSVSFQENGTAVTAIPNEGYVFIGWSDEVETATRTEKGVTSNIEVTARFEKISYTVNYLTDGNGTLQGETVQTVKYKESGTEVTAIPNEGYVFVGWSDGVKTATRTEREVTSNVEVAARFEKISYTVNYLTDGNGTLQGETVQTVKYKESGTAVTAIPNEGYVFVGWSDGVKTETRAEQGVTSNVEVTARFEKISYTVNYLTDGNGTLQGETVQTVKYKESGTAVTAIPNEGYVFVGWSDGVETATRIDIYVKSEIVVVALFDKKAIEVYYYVNNVSLGSIQLLSLDTYYAEVIKYGDDGPKVNALPKEDIYGRKYKFMGWSDGVLTADRQDLNIKSNISVCAYFGYSVEYQVYGNMGGKIIGDVSQVILPNEISKEVVAIPNEGYVFAGWSDLSLEYNRQDTIYYDRNIEILAYFEPIEKTLKYDYGIAIGTPTVTYVTLNRNNIQSTKFVVPNCSGYKFCGWYADREYLVKVVNENGRYMYGYATFSLETDTLYAKWQKEGEEKDTHKILLVFVDEVQTELYSTKLSQNIKVHSKMSALDYEMSKWIGKKFYETLSKWFKDSVAFEVDSYFTTQVVKDGFLEGTVTNGMTVYNLFASGVSEIFDLLHKYHNILVTVNMNDYFYNLHNSSGIATVKEGCIYMEGYWYNHLINHEPLKDYMDQLNSDNCDLSSTSINTYIHEFTHTVEMNFDMAQKGLHYVLKVNPLNDTWNVMKLYLLNDLVIDGFNFGIPNKYWAHKYEVGVNYVVAPINGRDCGKIIVVGEEDNRPLWIKYISRNVQYSSDLVVEAIPDEGYRFVRWSDGITTAIRYDVNIIARIHVEAIFEKI